MKSMIAFIVFLNLSSHADAKKSIVRTTLVIGEDDAVASVKNVYANVTRNMTNFRQLVNELQDQVVPTASISANCNANFGNIPIITVETRQNSPTIPVKGAPSLVMCNVGVSHTWKGAITKNELLLEELATRMKESPESIVILVDGEDIGYGGGCS